MERADRRLQLKQLREEAQAIQQGAVKENVVSVANRIEDRAEMLLEDIEE